MNKKELKKLALEDLKRSGLDNKDFIKMKLVVCTEDEASTVLNSTFCTYGYALPYFNYKGKLTENIRFKFLDDLRNEKNKTVKYSQPKGTKSYLYFPPNIKWTKILKDTSITVIITEGEKKAYAACKTGIPTIGLSGVWAFKSKKEGKDLIDDFNAIELKDREVLICFDNDLQSNADVLKASRTLAKSLSERGAIPSQKLLPFDPYNKIGLDDYLLNHTVKDFEELPSEPFLNVCAISELNSEVAYIKNLGKFYVFNDKLLTSAAGLKNEVFSNRTYKEDGKEINTALEWTKSSNRREHSCLTYKPAQPQVTDENEFNLWKGWGCEPIKGSVKPFLNAVKQIFNNDKELITWFMNWVAYPIQHPATKMLTAVLLQSIEQGTGKSSLGMCIGAMYGDNYQLVDDTQLHGSFNEWAVNKQFVLGDEVSGKDKRSESDAIKNLITRPIITINKKYEPTYNVPDCINYLFTSNHPDALSIEPDDRRIFVYKIKSGNGLTLKQGKQLEIFRNGKGKNYLLYYFINEYKISKDFDHRSRPPMTDAKLELIDASLTDVERWLTDIRINPNHALKTGGIDTKRDLYTTTQLVKIYEARNKKAHVTSTAMGKALNKIFFDSPKRTIVTNEGTMSIRAIRNVSKWNKASYKEWQDHLNKLAAKVKNNKMKVIK
ncbi:MAG TPA: DUF3854 domain-containing protein [Gammaproteobacteria bacterium]|nr:DUF3854 domain-containing protein [Gammaproteobacteria bacterium]